MGLDNLIGGLVHAYGHKDNRSSGYGFEQHQEFVSHKDHRVHYDQRMRLPANQGRPTMGHMPPYCEEDSDSDMEGYYESRRRHQTTVLPHHQQPPHLNFMPPPPMAQPHHNGWNELDAYQHGGHGKQQHGGHGMQHGAYGMQQHGGHGMQHHDVHGMKHQGAHVYPIHGNGGGHHKAGWGSKGL